jgi:hypothetical protein
MIQLARRVPWLLAFLAVAALGTACTLTTEPAYAEVEVAPPNIEASPSTVYEGRTVYLHNDRWYYRSGARWGYYRREPEFLVRQRTVVRQAPPAPVREYEAPHGAPPAVQVH